MTNKVKLIQLGDRVTIFFTDDSQLEGIILSMPQGPGDVAQIEKPDGRVMALNLNSLTFEYMLKEMGEEG